MAATPHLTLPLAAPAAFIDVEGEIEYWRRTYRDHPAFSPRRHFAVYEPALRIGIGAFVEDSARTFEECRDALEDAYQQRAAAHWLDWYEAGSAAAAAWHRLARRHRAANPTAVQALPGTPSGIAIAS